MSKLLRGSVQRHLVRLTLPGIGGMLAIMVFNLTDTWFVSRLGTAELAAMGFIFTIVLMIGSLAQGFSSGAASIISRALGARRHALAARTVADGLVLTVLGTLVVSAIGWATIDPLFTLLGARGAVLDRVREYMQVWYLGAVFAIMPPVSDGCLRAAGDMVRPLLVMCAVALLNVVLDPLLIFGWGPIPALGMRGAALATVLARLIATSASLSFLHQKHRLIDWSCPQLRELWRSWREILRLGVPAAITQALYPVAQAFFLRLASGVGGVQGVAAFATGARVEAFVLIVAFAYGIALVPFVGHNFGARAYDRIEKTRRITFRFVFVYAGVALLILWLCARPVCGWFSPDALVVDWSVTYLLISVVGIVGIVMSIWMSQWLNVMGLPRPAMAINLSRVFLWLMPLSWLGSRLGGFVGLVVGIAIANLLTGIQTEWIVRREWAKISKEGSGDLRIGARKVDRAVPFMV